MELSTHISAIRTIISSLYGFQPSPLVLCLQNGEFRTRITSLCGSQTSPVILCMQKSAPSIRITRLYGFQPSSVVFECKTWTFGSELQVSMGSRLHLSFCEYKTAWLASDLLVSMGPSPHRCCLHLNKEFWSRITSLYWSLTTPLILCLQNSLISFRITSLCGSHTSPVVFACNTAWLTSELLVSMGPCSHLWFLHARQRILDQKYQSLWVPHLTCHFVHAKQRD